ncbi:MULTISPECIES: hypothetical protein [Burkholderiaceae]|uniref:Uncharacterized protein n=2 Tax=Burkholderiaceae TaxID=119060 RepID=A4JV38_BURVG|nr:MULTISPECIES: hypothetical protein [Burkholderiaceae]ABO60141.1 conserved hypothetical protein [Burkholderia vietnamiensis G4]ASW03703.1 hypothetical protein CJU94_36515 [Paraburkholderia aromaticivorans]MBR8008560.1 hypothetical protein [Burkholderia vietnamiensis]MBR8054694.1 hypothetical protein [Burkholderia vietnamiensis]MCA7889857.1 hypothetical protein [Burkholderia contaminans]
MPRLRSTENLHCAVIDENHPATLLITIPMHRWRAIFLVLLLIVSSLPIRSTAATLMPGDVQSGMGEALPMRDMRFAEQLTYSVSSRYLPGAVGECHSQHHDNGSPGHRHAVSQCCVSTPCCVGAVAPTPSSILPGREIAILHPGHPASDAATSFLTAGIERPPRLFLA